MLHLFEHWMGIDSQTTGWYMFWSGFAPAGAAWMCFLFAWFSLRVELKALRLETELLSRELKKASNA